MKNYAAGDEGVIACREWVLNQGLLGLSACF
jgi:hypothetical protein